MISRLSALLVMTLVVASSGWAQRKAVDEVLPTQEFLARFGLERAWWAQASLNPSRDKVANIGIDEDTVYVMASSGVASAFDAENGKLLWKAQLGRADDPSFAAVSNMDTAVFVVGNTMYGIRRNTGKLLWQIPLPSSPSTSVAMNSELIFVGMLDGSVYAFNQGKILSYYQRGMLPAYQKETVVWKYKSAKEVTSTPVVNFRRDVWQVSFASRDGILYSVTADQRKLLYQFETDAPILAPLAGNKETLILASEDRTVYGLEPDNGRILWEHVFNTSIRTRPFLMIDSVYLSPDRIGTYCIDARRGVERWRNGQISRVFGQARNVIFAEDHSANLVTLDREKGTIEGTVGLKEFPTRVVNERTDRFFAISQSGAILCLRLAGKKYPTYYSNPEVQPIVPEFETEESQPAETDEPKKDEPKKDE